MKRVAILQPNYIPWRGYFDLINYVDEFIIYDDAQYTKRDWRNRNIIKTPKGLSWLSIPVEVKGKYLQKIKDTKISSSFWQKKHLDTIKFCYLKAKYFKLIYSLIEPLYIRKPYVYLSETNINFLKGINSFLDIKTVISKSSDFSLPHGKNDRLIYLVKKAKGDIYVSGNSAKNYLDLNVFANNEVSVEWYNYNHLIEYEQLWGKFENFVSVIDLLMNVGPKSKTHINLNKKYL